MARLCIILGLLLLSTASISAFSMDFSDIREILGFSREFIMGTLESVEWIRRDNKDHGELDFPFVKRTEKKLMNGINLVNRRIINLEERMNERTNEVIDRILHDLPLREQLNRNLNDLNRYLGRINDIYKDFLEYSNHSDRYEIYTRLEFARATVTLELGALPDLLASIHRLICPTGLDSPEKGVFVQLARNSKEASSQICDEQQSPQQLLYNLYNIITLTEIRGSMMMQFSYAFLRLHKNGSFEYETNKTLRDYETRVSETIRAVRTAMAFAPRDLWRCDPASHKRKEGETYTELKQLFQGYIVNEVDLNPTSTCRENCAYYTYSKVEGCYENQYCSQQRRCYGKVLNCQYIDSDMWICPSRNSNRRYDYIEYENGRVFGNKGTCSRPTTKVDSWWRWLFWHCSYCMCLCDDYNSSSDRYFNLRDITSDVLNNKVITGLRLIKVNQIVHIQIQEGELMERAEINHLTVSWKPVDNFTTIDRNVLNERDFHTLSWEKRAIDLDDLIAPEEHLLTGVRFRVLGAHLNFEIRVTPFNFTSGKLIRPLEKSTWISNDNTDVNANVNQRTELLLKKPDIPTRTEAPTFPDSKTNQFLNFGPTDMEKDASQTTVPFLDTQRVETNPPFPLSGAGVFHKGRDGNGGYIALKIMTYDFKDHLKDPVPPPSLLKYSHELNDIPVQK